MRVTIEVTNEAEGRFTAKRTVIQRDEYNTDEEVESAAVSFIREAKLANEATLKDAVTEVAASSSVIG